MNDEAVHEGLCPATRAVFEIISRRWNGLIMQTLVHGELCFMEIERRIPGISGRLLSLRLRELEDKGIVGRKVESGRPVRVRYRLNPKGAELATVLEGLVAWAQRWSAGNSSDTADTVQEKASRNGTPPTDNTLRTAFSFDMNPEEQVDAQSAASLPGIPLEQRTDIDL